MRVPPHFPLAILAWCALFFAPVPTVRANFSEGIHRDVAGTGDARNRVHCVHYLGRSADEIRDRQVHAPVPFIAASRPNVDPRLDRLVQKALAKSRDDRHPNMQELRADLKSLLVAEGAPVRPPARSVPSFPSQPRIRAGVEEPSSPRAMPVSREAPSVPPPTATTRVSAC